MFQLSTHEHVRIYVDTLCALARDARAQRNQGALEFVGGYLVKLMPESSLAAFREELRGIPMSGMPADGAYCVAENTAPVGTLINRTLVDEVAAERELTAVVEF